MRCRKVGITPIASAEPSGGTISGYSSHRHTDTRNREQKAERSNINRERHTPVQIARSGCSACLILIAAAFASSCALAQDVYPSRPIQIVIPFPAGGSLDIGMRVIQQRLSETLGVPLILMNRPGASGVIGMSSRRIGPAGWVHARRNLHLHADGRATRHAEPALQNFRLCPDR